MIPLPEQWRGKRFAVVGFGAREGRATLSYLVERGANVTLFDQKPFDQWSAEDQAFIKSLNVPVVFGGRYLSEIGTVDVVFRNPAVPYLTPELQAFKENGGVLTSQTEYFFQHCPAVIVGVTGTNGKGTTTTMIHQGLELAGKKSFLTGNVGLTQPFEFLDTLTESDTVCYELSSFQLQGLSKSPHIAVVLKITEDHLDHHKTFDEYVSAKATITQHQSPSDVAIVAMDSSSARLAGEQGSAVRKYFSTEHETDAYVSAGTVYLGTEPLVSSAEVKLKGKHNLENICAASLALHALGVSRANIVEAVKNFRGLPHRLEHVGTFGGVSFYDDSIATTPEPTIAAINAFTEPLAVILGGSSKSSDFTPLAKSLLAAKNIRGVVLVGQEAPRIEALLEAPAFTVAHAATMGEAVREAAKLAGTGGVVLLSPACASFDMFKNYADRGNQFKTAAEAQV